MVCSHVSLFVSACVCTCLCGVCVCVSVYLYIYYIYLDTQIRQLSLYIHAMLCMVLFCFVFSCNIFALHPWLAACCGKGPGWALSRRDVSGHLQSNQRTSTGLGNSPLFGLQKKGTPWYPQFSSISMGSSITNQPFGDTPRKYLRRNPKSSVDIPRDVPRPHTAIVSKAILVTQVSLATRNPNGNGWMSGNIFTEPKKNKDVGTPKWMVY